MDYKKKYKEALERAKGVIEQNPLMEYLKKGIEYIFPELAESEDERISKEIIKYLEQTVPHHHRDEVLKSKEWIAWLEKQGEQKSVNKVEPKFHKGQWIIWQDKCYKVNYNGCGYELIDQNGLRTSLEYGTVDKSAHLWTIDDAKKGDVLINWNNTATPSTKLSHLGLPEPQFGFHPATKEERDLLFQKMKESGYEWDAEKKELRKIEQKLVELAKGEDYGIDGLYAAIDILQKTLGEVEGYQTDDGILEHECAISAVKELSKQKPAWGEEDEEMCQETIDWFEKKCFPYALGNDNPARESIKWLKSLKQRIFKGEE